VRLEFRVLGLAALASQLFWTTVRAQDHDDTFTVGDIRIEGLQRISEGTVFNYLPVNIGDKLDGQRIGEAMRALYATGFFRDVELRRDGNILLVVVVERPSIAKFEIKGNKDIKTEDLTKSLRNVGLATGKTFDRSVLDEVKQYLTDQYFSRGKYAVRVDTKITDLPGNKVDVIVDIKEGKRAKIEMINLVGDTKFKEKDVLAGFELKTPNWLSWYKQDDRYSRESLTGDLEKLRSYYMDRGYANFQIDSTQVTIAPDKDDMFITVNIDEGEVFKVSDIKLAGTMVVPEADLRKLLVIHPGDTYSRKLITSTQQLMSYRLGADGYAFAKIDPVPTADNDKKTVAITFFIEPGNRVYVRHINFNNTTAINDETLRREMRQLEGGWLSNSAVERSKERLQRLPYVEKVEFENKPVPGSADLVDVDFNIKEGLPGQFGGGIGYSEAQKFSLNGNFVHSNFLGTGDRVAVELNAGRYSKSYTVAQTDPYVTIDNISRTISFTYRDITQFVAVLDQADDLGVAMVVSDQRVSIPRHRRIRQQEHVGGLARLQCATIGLLGQEQRRYLPARPRRYQRRRRDQLIGQSLYGVWNRFLHLRTYRRLVLRGPQSRAVPRQGNEDNPVRQICAALERCPLLPVELRCHQVHSVMGQMAAVRAGVGGLCLGAGSHDLLAALPQLLRGRPRQRQRLPREHPGAAGQHRNRQPLRRKFSSGQPL